MLPKPTTSLTGRKQEFSTRALIHSQERFANPLKCVKRGPWQSTTTRASILLDHIYDTLLKSTLHPGKATSIIGRFPGKSSEPKHL